MEPIHIPRLTKALHQTEVIEFDEAVPGLESLTPVKGQMKVSHKGNYLEVSAKAETIITLSCDRCLKQYNYRLAIAPTELIWLDEAAKQDDLDLLDRDISPEDLVETLPPRGYFDPTTWLYEQLSLEIPQQQICDQSCAGIQLPNKPEKPVVDQRWASLEALREQFSSN
ncbi:YceD family protein [Leptothermofonsia sp. ETS-13]|uniref:YceD family protein n=1 Tax=Leptothermofonsia sp. ETS-13 TaxID=3035696 RepID=UPI003BA2B22F